MKKFTVAVSVALTAALTFVSCNSKKTKVAEPEAPAYEVVTYVYSGGDVLPDPTLVTTINYAFANIDSARSGFFINNEPRFREIVNLKKENPALKVLVTIGGTCESGLTAMAADPANRSSLAGQCRRVIEEYGIDGIDFDWEFPGAPKGGTPDDYDNFALVLKEVRDSIGPDKLLTLAAGGDLAGMDPDNVGPYLDVLDYVNVMAYDLSGTPTTHHTPLYRSPITGWRSVDEVVEDYVNHGVPFDKMMLGLGFYGRGDGTHYTEWTNSEQAKPYGDLTEQWDSIGCVPYIADAEGVLTVGYENPRSIEIKCDYLKDKGFRGAMVWRTELDLDSMQMARVVARSLLNVE